jgi:allantoicase
MYLLYRFDCIPTIVVIEISRLHSRDEQQDDSSQSDVANQEDSFQNAHCAFRANTVREYSHVKLKLNENV